MASCVPPAGRLRRSGRSTLTISKRFRYSDRGMRTTTPRVREKVRTAPSCTIATWIPPYPSRTRASGTGDGARGTAGCPRGAWPASFVVWKKKKTGENRLVGCPLLRDGKRCPDQPYGGASAVAPSGGRAALPADRRPGPRGEAQHHGPMAGGGGSRAFGSTTTSRTSTCAASSATATTLSAKSSPCRARSTSGASSRGRKAGSSGAVGGGVRDRQATRAQHRHRGLAAHPRGLRVPEPGRRLREVAGPARARTRGPAPALLRDDEPLLPVRRRSRRARPKKAHPWSPCTRP